MSLNDQDAISALVSDLHWQIDQLPIRGVKDKAGNPYNPSYYKRGLKTAIQRGGPAVADFVRSYLTKPPSEGYRKLAQLNSLDLACEALVADETKPYAHLFSDEDRAAARKRLAPHLAAIQARETEREERIVGLAAGLPSDLTELRERAASTPEPEESVAVNEAILRLDGDDVVALNRLGRAREALGQLAAAKESFERVVELDPDNAIARRRLDGLERVAR